MNKIPRLFGNLEIRNIIMKLLDHLRPLKSFWERFPEQVKRLTVLAAVLLTVLLTVRSVLVPKDFGKYGHYRASAVEEIARQKMQYVGHELCTDCHDDVVAAKYKGYHKNLSCEICHGAAVAHVELPDSIKPPAPRGRGYCPLCHEYLPSRPTGFPQIVSASHNPMKPCISCHDPHDPKPPVPPQECEACHATIARTKALSHHVYIPCVRCHEAPREHKISPREYLPAKPRTREFCGECHSKDAPDGTGIRKVDMDTHWHMYVCWQCHYPHLPEVQ